MQTNPCLVPDLRLYQAIRGIAKEPVQLERNDILNLLAKVWHHGFGKTF